MKTDIRKLALSILGCLLVAIPMLVFRTPVVAGAMLLHVGSVTPRMAQCGSTVEVTIRGISLKDPREIIFYKPGIKAIDLEMLPNLPNPISLMHGGRMQEVIRCKFIIAPDAPPGEYPFRIRTATQITSLATFQVSPFAVIDENEKDHNTNDTLATAMQVTPNVTIRGHMKAGRKGDVDMYRVPAIAGQRLSVEVDAVRIADAHYGDSEFDMAIRILDENGRELASNDDNPLHIQDPMVAVRLPGNGHVFVEVKRSVFNTSDCTYCVHISSTRRPLAAFPPGGQAGTTQAIQFSGDPLGAFQESVAIPSTTGTFDYFGGAPTALALRSCSFPNLIKKEGAGETPVPNLPIAINGFIEKPGDVDGFRLKVKKNDRHRVRVFASTLGSPMDPAIRIRPIGKDGKPGAVELEADDAQPNERDIFGTSFRSRGGLKEILDPSVIWEPKSDGEYILEVEDRGGNSGALCVYRMEIDQPPDAVHTYLASTAFDWMECIRTSGLAVPRGNRLTVNVSLPPGFGNTFRGEMELRAHGLPPGVRMYSPKIPAGKTLWPVQFVAEETAIPSTALITLEAVPLDANKRIQSFSQQSVPFINHSGGDAWRTVRLDKFVLAVTEPAPFSLDVKMPQLPLVRGGELAIPVRVTRHNGFTGAIEFLCDWVPQGVGMQPATIIPANETEGVLRISGDLNAPLGAAPLVVIANNVREDMDAYLGTGRIRVSSEMATLNIAEPFVDLTSQPESVRRGAKLKYTWAVQHKSPFEGTATVKLLGLPKGVNTLEPLPTLTRETKQVTFEIEATDDALLGSVQGIACEILVRAGTQEIRQRTGKGTLRIDPKK